MGIEVPRAPRLADEPEYAGRLRLLGELICRPRSSRVARALVCAALALMLLGLALLVLAGVVAFAPGSMLAQAVLGLVPGGR